MIMIIIMINICIVLIILLHIILCSANSKHVLTVVLPRTRNQGETLVFPGGTQNVSPPITHTANLRTNIHGFQRGLTQA